MPGNEQPKPSERSFKELLSTLEKGLQSGHDILQRYQTPGVLIGSALSYLFNPNPRQLPKELHDIDILIPSISCDDHPVLREGSNLEFTLDWWISHSTSERPHNDNELLKMLDPSFDIIIPGANRPLVSFKDAVGLYWALSLKEGVPLNPGLYVLDPEFAKMITTQELKRDLPKSAADKLRKRVLESWDKSRYNLPYTLLSPDDVSVKLFNEKSPIAEYCKTYYKSHNYKPF